MMRIGIGYDVHRLISGHKLILGGVEIPFDKGLLGHSDADCLVHAIIDSILGALCQNDMGQHFSDTDDQYKNISSLKLLLYTKKILDKANYQVNNIDSVIIMQKPKLADYISRMRENIARCLDIDKNKINIKATTEEGLGFTGDSSGVACQAVCLLIRKES